MHVEHSCNTVHLARDMIHVLEGDTGVNKTDKTPAVVELTLHG